MINFKKILMNRTYKNIINNINDNFNEVSNKFEQKSNFIPYTIKAGNWIGRIYNLENDYPSNLYNLEIFLSDKATIEEYKSFADASLIGNDTKNTMKAFGKIPLIDINVTLKVVEKNVNNN